MDQELLAGAMRLDGRLRRSSRSRSSGRRRSRRRAARPRPLARRRSPRRDRGAGARRARRRRTASAAAARRRRGTSPTARSTGTGSRSSCTAVASPPCTRCGSRAAGRAARPRARRRRGEVTDARRALVPIVVLRLRRAGQRRRHARPSTTSCDGKLWGFGLLPAHATHAGDRARRRARRPRAGSTASRTARPVFTSRTLDGLVGRRCT